MDHIKENFIKLQDFFDKYYKIIIPALLILLPLAVYWQATGFEMVWDDNLGYFGVHPLLVDVSWKNMIKNWTEPYMGVYTPLMGTFWAGVKLLGDFFSSGREAYNLFVFHLVNVLLHIANGFLVYWIINFIIKNRWAAVAGALLFLLHPIQAQTVAWLSGVRDLLAVFLALSAVCFYLTACSEEGNEGGAFIKYYILSIFMFVLALLTKPTVVSLPLLIGALDLFIFKRSVKSIILRILPWFLFILVALLTVKERGAVAKPPVWSWPMIWMDAINFYVYKIIFPVSLAASYARTPAYLIGQWWFYILWMVPVIVSYELWTHRKKYAMAVLSFLVFVIGFLPMSGLLPFTFQILWSTVADRYIYLSMLGVSLLTAHFLTRYRRPIVWGSVIALVFVLGVKSFAVQVPVWKNNFTLWDHCISITPEEPQAYYNRGMYFLRKEDYQNALMDFNKALEINPKMANVYQNRGTIYKLMKNFDLALRDYNRSIELEPDTSQSYYNRGNLFKETGYIKEALADYNRALKLDEYNINSYLNRGIILGAMNNFDAALKDYKRALEIKPDFAEIYYNRGNLYVKLKNYTEAVNDYNRAVRANPGLISAYINRSGAHVLMNDYKSALSDAEQALSIDPNNQKARDLKRILSEKLNIK